MSTPTTTDRGSDNIPLGAQQLYKADGTPISSSSPIPVGASVTFHSNLGAIEAASVATGARTVKKVRGLNGTSTLYYLQLHDKASAPSAAAVPLLSFPVGIGVASSLTVDERPSPGDPDYYSVTLGIWVGWSSTYGTYTAVSPTTQAIEVEYV